MIDEVSLGQKLDVMYIAGRRKIHLIANGNDSCRAAIKTSCQPQLVSKERIWKQHDKAFSECIDWILHIWAGCERVNLLGVNSNNSNEIYCPFSFQRYTPIEQTIVASLLSRLCVRHKLLLKKGYGTTKHFLSGLMELSTYGLDVNV